MSIRWIMGITLLWTLSQFVCCIGQGLYTGEDIKALINAMTGYQYLQSQGILALPMMGATFFLSLPKLLAFDYSFFEQSTGFMMLRYVGMCVSVGVVFGLLQVFLPMFQGLASRLLKLFGG